ncbi:MAG: GTPase ObgE [Myxococcales bacterium]|nr:GTPase ObgE [Myxococcales bacterium]
MRFIDETVVTVEGGHGGRGCVAFRREAHVPLGGPSGGDGGDGGSVTLVATTRAATLLDLHFTRSYVAERGEHGMGSDCHGKNGKSIELPVPIGTMIFDDETGELIGDLVEDQQHLVVAKGGRGGKGNAHFATSTRQAPEYAQPGEEGASRRIRLELKLLADVGLVGFPNAGKSSLIRRLSRSRARVADYPFTTLVPNLGVVAYDDDRSFVMADVPGLIRGASDGAGLGHQFLRHIERCRILVYLLDLAGDLSPREAYLILRNELEKYEPELLTRDRVVCLSKADLVDEEWVKLTIDDLKEEGIVDTVVLSGTEATTTQTLRGRLASLLSGRASLYEF